MDRALHDAEALLEGGIRHVIVENDGDRPFGIENEDYNFNRVAAEIATFGTIIREEFPDLTLGVQVLYNYSFTPSIVKAIGGKFMRSQFYCETRRTSDQRVITPTAHRMHTANQRPGHDFVILADIDSKGSAPVDENYNPEDSVRIATTTDIPSALITTGIETGVAPDKEQVGRFRELVDKYALDMPVGVGSGTTPEAVRAGLIEHANFAIVGSYFKTDGKVDPAKVRTLVQTVEEMHGN